MSFPYICVSGSPRERGLQYGRQASQQIHVGLEIYMSAFRGRGFTDAKVAAIASEFADVIESAEPVLFEELQGIAEGSDVGFNFIIAMNARTEILRRQEDGCTGIACLPEVTSNSHTLLAQNWDWIPACRDSTIVLHVRPDEGPEFITLVEAGLLGRGGLNSAGVGVAGNFLQSDEDFGQSGLPIALIRRKILSSESYAEAIGVVMNSPRAFSSNHLIASSLGDAIDFEATPNNVYPLFPKSGILEHANHFRSKTALMRLRDTGVQRLPDSLYRDRRLRKVVADSSASIDVEDLQVGLRDHFGAPAAICRHSASGTNASISTTVASIVMDLHEGRIWVAAGPPCENEYYEYSLDGVVKHEV